ncbi:MAG: DUF2147 domain-containing protein [Leptospirales bacterium]|nr:DUF2147 domain-containing protein [Leptospirales bacterium]
MRKFTIGLLVLGLLSAGSLSAAPDSVLGNWRTENNKSVVNIYKCGGNYCGNIVSLAEPNYPANDPKGMAGKPKIDRNNPEEKFRSRPIVGLFLLWGFVPDGENSWKNGQIYDPESGKVYSCKMTLNGNQLEVRGFIGVSFIGRTSIWTR